MLMLIGGCSAENSGDIKKRKKKTDGWEKTKRRKRKGPKKPATEERK
jgi:hypothetical protein